MKTKIQKTDAQLIKEGKFYGTHKRAKDLRKQRHARDVAFRMIENLPPGWKTPIYILPLGVRYKQDVQGDCQTQNRRLCRWLLAEPTRNLCDRKPYIYTQAAGRYSGRNHYARVNHIPRVRSCVKITPKRLLWFIGDGSGILHAPIGWQFGHDGNGVFVVQTRRGNTSNYRIYLDADKILQGRSTWCASAINSIRDFWQFIRDCVRVREARERRQRMIARVCRTTVSATVRLYVKGILWQVTLKRRARMPDETRYP